MLLRLKKVSVIQWIYYSAIRDHPNDIVIKCRGAELTRDNFGLKSDLNSPNSFINDWMVRICSVINKEIAKKIGFAWSDDKITLVESAEIHGYKSRNIVRCLVDRFDAFFKNNNLTADKKKIVDQIEMLKRLDDISVWILIDDLDATFQNTQQECLSLSTFFSACRYLMQDILGIKIRVSMRSDVWPIIRRYDESLDKMEQYAREIIWELDDFRKLLYMRVKSQCQELDHKIPSKFPQERDDEYEERIIG